MQNYKPISMDDIAVTALCKLQDSIDSTATCFSGTAFPTENVAIGMLCYRTDEGALYQLTALPSTWTKVGGSDITVDTALSTSSTNPVTNKAITTGINSVSTALSDFEDVVVDTYAKTSDVTTSLATKADKSDTYTKTEVDSRVSAIPKFSIDVVDTLPTSGSSETVYLVKTGETSPDLYTEYIYVNGAWEKLGTQTTDLTDYVKNEELANVAKTGSYTDLTNTPTIDSELNITSTNAVQNKVVTDTFEEIMNNYLKYCVNAIVANDDGGSFTYEKVDESAGKISTNNVYQMDWTPYPDILSVALAPYGGQNGSIGYTTKVKIRPNTGAITCGTVNDVDITTLATQTYVTNAITTAINNITNGNEVSY